MRRALAFAPLLLATAACVTTQAEAAPRTKQCTDGSTVRWNRPCPPPPAGTPQPPMLEPDPVVTEPAPTEPAPTEPVPPPPEPPPPSDPAPEPVNSGYVPTPSLDGLPEIADGLDITALTIDVSKYGHKTAAPDVVGAFRMDCGPGQVLNDDPIVFPGQPGRAHMHGFYGNTGANAYSTFETLRTTGDSTCLNPLNRSAYWAPKMIDPVRKLAFRVNHTKLYYKRRPKSDPLCSLTTSPNAEGECIPLPSGLRFIFGYDMLTGQTPKGSFYWVCADSNTTKAPDPSHKPNLKLAMALCPVGARVAAVLKAPSCWDSKYLDTPNHRDHMAYMTRNAAGFNRCDADHPYVVPGITLMQVWEVTPELKASADAGNLVVSSDMKVAGAEPGSTYHGDFYMAWNREVHLTFVHNCIDLLYNCSSGDLGNGRMLKNLSTAKFPPAPQVVPLP